MKPDLLMVGPLPPKQMADLELDFTIHRLWEVPEAERPGFLAKLAGSVRFMATTGFHGADGVLIQACPKLEIISCFGVGVDAIDFSVANPRGIAVTNTPEVLNEDVADLALGLMLTVARRLVVADAHVRSGKWLKGAMPLATKMSGKRLGILGLGRIGKAIAERAQAFRMEIGYFGRNRQPDVPYRFYGNLEEMARESDFLVVIAPGGATTKHLVDARILMALGPKGVLVNVARGSLVDEPALVHALQTGVLGGAGLDVFADEPRVPEALFQMENVVLTPHIGSATHETRGAMADLVVNNLRAHLKGGPLLTRYN